MRCKSNDSGNVPCTEEATVTVFWPGQETVACDRHHKKMQGVAGFMGFALSSRSLPPEATGNPYIDAALADPANPIKTAGQCCAHVPGHKCVCVCPKPGHIS